MRSLFIIVALATICAVQAVNIPFTNCGTSADILTINSATANVFPPVPGQSFAMSIDGSLSESLPGGVFNIAVFFDGIPLLDQKGDLKQLFSGYQWPIPAGPLNFSQTVDVPTAVPGGSYIVKLIASDLSAKEIVCVSIVATIGPAAKTNPHVPKPMITEDEELLETATDVPVTYTNCGASGDIDTISAVTANVWPPVLGSNFTFQVSGTVDEEITSGTYNTVVNFDFAPAVNSTSTLADFGVSFPVEAGELDLSMTMDLGGKTPSGVYEVILRPFDQNGNELFCIDMQFNL